MPSRFPQNPLFPVGWRGTLFQGGLLGTDGDLGVAIGRFQAGVSEPGTDHIHFDSGLEQVNGRAVPTMSSKGNNILD